MESAINIKWDESLAVGVDEVDADHRELINLFNQLFASCFAAVGSLIIADTLKKLLDYTKYHFQREEKLMHKEGYPDFAFHKELHDDLLLITLNFQEQLQTADMHDISNEALEFLRSWIVNHIMESDKAFANYMRLQKQHK